MVGVIAVTDLFRSADQTLQVLITKKSMLVSLVDVKSHIEFFLNLARVQKHLPFLLLHSFPLPLLKLNLLYFSQILSLFIIPLARLNVHNLGLTRCDHALHLAILSVRRRLH